MKSRTIGHIQDVVDWGLCSGCGICYSNCTKNAIKLIDFPDLGIRPVINRDLCGNCSECLATCPGYSLIYRSNGSAAMHDIDLDENVEIWKGYAADPEIRFRASSGGALSAIALYCLESGVMDYLVHTGMDTETPWINKTYISRSREDILDRSGSRYSPSSPGEGLKEVRSNIGSCLFIGKPCDAAGAVLSRKRHPDLNRKLILIMSFFCAGIPNSRGTLELLKTMNLKTENVSSVSYRGNGWPGGFTVSLKDCSYKRCLSYEATWGYLSKYVPMRCRLCPNGLGQLSDISCGDNWNLYPGNAEGHSLILAHTDRGKEFVQKASSAGYINIEPVSHSELTAAQPNLLRRQTQIHGRLAAMKLLMIPTPDFKGFSIERYWQKQSFISKSRIIFGTLKRILRRGLWHRNHPQPYRTA